MIVGIFVSFPGVALFARRKCTNRNAINGATASSARTRSHAYQYVLLRVADMCIVEGTTMRQHTPAFVVTIAFESALDSLPCCHTEGIMN